MWGPAPAAPDEDDDDDDEDEDDDDDDEDEDDNYHYHAHDDYARARLTNYWPASMSSVQLKTRHDLSSPVTARRCQGDKTLRSLTNVFGEMFYNTFLKDRRLKAPGTQKAKIPMTYQNIIMSSCHLVILSSCHLVILSSCHPVIMSSCHLVIKAPDRHRPEVQWPTRTWRPAPVGWCTADQSCCQRNICQINIHQMHSCIPMQVCKYAYQCKEYSTV